MIAVSTSQHSRPGGGALKDVAGDVAQGFEPGGPTLEDSTSVAKAFMATCGGVYRETRKWSSWGLSRVVGAVTGHDAGDQTT